MKSLLTVIIALGCVISVSAVKPPPVIMREITLSNGATYVGQISPAGLPLGFGLMSETNGTVFVGIFDKLGRPTIGKASFPDGRSSIGGFGKHDTEFVSIRYASGLIQIGASTGVGSLLYTNGTYTGYVHNGTRSGIGVREWQDGNVFIGTYVDDEATGIGCHWIPGTELYIGEVDGSTRHGYGVAHWFTNSILLRYEGEYDHNSLSGKGSFFWRNGERYIGEYRNNLRNGHGIYYYNDGTHTEGTWVEDKFINNDEEVQHAPPEGRGEAPRP